MKKIKTAIIHWLGGVTIEEATNNAVACQIEAIKAAFKAFLEKISKYKDLPADEWCVRVWILAEKLADTKVTAEDRQKKED